MNTNRYAVIMAGGVGSRFWPVSRKSRPKQFLDLLGAGRTLIQKTYDRLSTLIPKENIFILTNERYLDLVTTQLPNITSRQLVLEPAMRNTAPCILLSALKIHKENPEASMIVAPSDHWIENEITFRQNTEAAFTAAEKNNSLITLGIKPAFPHIGYGYIQYAKDDPAPDKTVVKFTEKPPYEKAKTFLASGDYLWNAGIFIWRTSTVLQAFKKWLPEMHALFSSGQTVLNTTEEEHFIAQTYEKAQNISLDYALMEKAENVKVIPANFDWSDLGSWGALYDMLEKDMHDNVIIDAKTYLKNSHGNIIDTPRGKIVVIKDLSDHIVVDNDSVLLIYPKEKEQEIKEIRTNIREKFGNELG